MRRETQNLLLVLLGQAILKISFDGTYLRYVKPGMFAWLVGAGIVIAGLGIVAIVRDILAARAGGFVSPSGCDHPHSAQSTWMLLLPVLAIFLIAPPALGADSVNRATSWAQRAQPAPPLPAISGKPPLLKVGDFVLRATWEPKGALTGRVVRLQGFVVHPKKNHETVQLARMHISCCAADASAIRVDLAGPAAPEAMRLPADTWIEITGQLRSGSITDVSEQTPTVDITAIRRIPVPANPYEY